MLEVYLLVLNLAAPDTNIFGQPTIKTWKKPVAITRTLESCEKEGKMFLDYVQWDDTIVISTECIKKEVKNEK